MFYPYLRQALKTGLKILFRLNIKNAMLVPETGRAILAGNHSGFLDTLILIAAVPRPIRFMAAEDVFHWPVIGGILRLAKVIPLSPGRGTQGLNAALEKLNDGELLCIFPEGKLTMDGTVGKFRKGVCYLHQKSEAPIIPFSLHGGFEAWGWGMPLPRLFSPVAVEFSQSIPFEPNLKDKDILTKLSTSVLGMLGNTIPEAAPAVEAVL
jgi:hypothetical protein